MRALPFSRCSRHSASRSSPASRRSYKNRFTVGPDSATAHSRAGASNTTDTPANPCCSSSLMSKRRSDSSRSASIVFSGTWMDRLIGWSAYVRAVAPERGRRLQSGQTCRPNRQRSVHRRVTQPGTEAIEIRLQSETTQLEVFREDGLKEVAHRDRPTVVGREEGGGQRAVADRA